jgi:hypothetical protein
LNGFLLHFLTFHKIDKTKYLFRVGESDDFRQKGLFDEIFSTSEASLLTQDLMSFRDEIEGHSIFSVMQIQS